MGQTSIGIPGRTSGVVPVKSEKKNLSFTIQETLETETRKSLEKPLKEIAE